MNEPDYSRAKVLGRIRAAVHASSRDPDPGKDWQAIERTYQRTPSRDRAAVIDLFQERLLDYDTGVFRTQNSQVAVMIAGILADRRQTALAVADDLDPKWLPPDGRFEQENQLTLEELATMDGAITGCTVAIAMTGTLILQNAPGQGRRILTLIPDYHLCVVRAAQVVETVPEAMALLAATPHLATTFISGPSATADIEMTRIKGVHGPRFLDVLLVDA